MVTSFKLVVLGFIIVKVIVTDEFIFTVDGYAAVKVGFCGEAVGVGVVVGLTEE
jgi:hypothetical protein